MKELTGIATKVLKRLTERLLESQCPVFVYKIDDYNIVFNGKKLIINDTPALECLAQDRIFVAIYAQEIEDYSHKISRHTKDMLLAYLERTQ